MSAARRRRKIEKQLAAREEYVRLRVEQLKRLEELEDRYERDLLEAMYGIKPMPERWLGTYSVKSIPSANYVVDSGEGVPND